MKKLFFVMLISAFLFLLLSIKATAQEKINLSPADLPKIEPIAEWGLSFGDLEEIEKKFENIFFTDELRADSIFVIRPGVTVEKDFIRNQFMLSVTLSYKFKTDNGYEVILKFSNEYERQYCLQRKTFSFFVISLDDPDLIKKTGLHHYMPSSTKSVCPAVERWEPFSSDEKKEKLYIKEGKLFVEAHDYGGYDMISALIEAEKRIKKGG